MMSGIQIFSDAAVLSASKFMMFRYFTVDSNILMGIVALCSAIKYKKMMTNNETKIPASLSIWQLLATTSVTLTLLVTVFFLAPTAPYHWILLFADSNFLLHLVNP
ncbi:MAG: hypothetical protein K5675_06120, partial [Lachnospiraceae bacterium]|nr:hypothetical protein [Lachnospiraceae bacterium]